MDANGLFKAVINKDFSIFRTVYEGTGGNLIFYVVSFHGVRLTLTLSEFEALTKAINKFNEND